MLVAVGRFVSGWLEVHVDHGAQAFSVDFDIGAVVEMLFEPAAEFSELLASGMDRPSVLEEAMLGPVPGCNVQQSHEVSLRKVSPHEKH